MISASRARPTLERCERPSSAPARTSGDQPGRLAQGPDEKHGLAGIRVGFIAPPLPFLAAARRLACRGRRTLSAGRIRRQCCGAASVSAPFGDALSGWPRFAKVPAGLLVDRL